jgi:4-amino-4-deoxy-L-arabinose transferase-like glycosyltransferase
MEIKSEEEKPLSAATAETVAAQTKAKRKRKIRLAILLAVWLIVYLPGLFHPALMDDADSVHAESAKEMILRHDWVDLYVDGVRYLQKAPLMYWMTATSYEIFGISEASTRLVLMISVLGLMISGWVFARRFFGEDAAFYAALILATAPGIYLYSRFLIPDVLVAMWTTFSFYFFLVGYEKRDASLYACWGLAIVTALNVLTNSLIGLVFPGLTILAFLAMMHDWGYLKKMRLFSSFIVFFVIAAPWHILAAIRNPAQPTGPEKGFLWDYFINEQFLRYLNKRIPHDYGKVPLGVFWAELLIWVVPWCIFLFPALREIPWRPHSWRKDMDPRSRAFLLVALWGLVVMAFFSFSSRQEYYSLPAVPAVALLAAAWMEREELSPQRSVERLWGKWMSVPLTLFALAGAGVAFALFALSKPFPPGTDIDKVLTVHPGRYKLSLGHLHDLTLASFGLFHTPLMVMGIALSAGTLLALFWRWRGSPWKSNMALTVMMVLALFAVHRGLDIFSPEISSKRLAVDIERYYKPGDEIVINGHYAFGSTLNFYTGHHVDVVFGGTNDFWFGSLFPDVPHVIWTKKFFDSQWNSSRRVFLFTQDFDRERILAGLNPQTLHVVGHEGDKVVYTNHPLGPPVHGPNYVPPNGAS